MKKCGIYCIENMINGKKYIGQTNNFYLRWNTHKHSLRKNKDSFHLQRAFNLDGSDNFKFYIVEECEIKFLNERESFWIEKYKTFGFNGEFGYNLTSGGSNPLETSEETRQKMSDNHANFSGENHPLFGIGHSLESKLKMSRVHSGSVNYKKKLSSSSIYFGVYFQTRGAKWISRVTIKGKPIYIGASGTEKECALMYDSFVIKNNLPNPTNFSER